MSDESKEGDYVIPVEGLGISRTFAVGPVQIFKSVHDLPFAHQINWEEPLQSHLLPKDGIPQAAALVHALSPQEAISIVEQCLEVLRVFQYGLIKSSFYLHFGLPGEITASNIFYIRHDEKASGSGFTSSGPHLGFELIESGIESWEQHAQALQYAATAINNREASDGALRALKGIQYFSRGILSRDPDLRVLLIVAGLEAMLNTGGKSPGRITVARYLVYLSCWKKSQCGDVSGQPCAFVVLDPSKEDDFKLVKKIERLAQADATWRCTYWEIFNTWYETRSGFAHGNSYDTEEEEAANFAYWAYHQYIAPVLEWLKEHPENPMGALGEELSVLDAAGIDWRTIVASGDLSSLLVHRKPLGN